LINDNGNLIKIDNKSIRLVNLFNDYFINVGKNLTDNFLGIDNLEQIVNNKPNLTNFDSIFLKNVDVLEVQSIINNFSDDTAAGYDQITIKILKSISKIIVKPLMYIYNLSIQNSVFPDNFKLAIIKPLFKGGDRKYMTNYRSISIITNFSKIFEKIIKSRLITYLEQNKLLSKSVWSRN